MAFSTTEVFKNRRKIEDLKFKKKSVQKYKNMKICVLFLTNLSTTDAFFPGMRTHELKQMNQNIKKVFQKKVSKGIPTYKKDGLSDDRKWSLIYIYNFFNSG